MSLPPMPVVSTKNSTTTYKTSIGNINCRCKKHTQ